MKQGEFSPLVSYNLINASLEFGLCLSVCLSVCHSSVTRLLLLIYFLELFMTIMSHCRYALPFIVVLPLRYKPSAIYVLRKSIMVVSR